MDVSFLKEKIKGASAESNFLYIIPINHPIRQTNIELSKFRLEKLWLRATHSGNLRNAVPGVYWYKEDENFYYISENNIEKVIPIKAFEFDFLTNAAYDNDGKIIPEDEVFGFVESDYCLRMIDTPMYVHFIIS